MSSNVFVATPEQRQNLLRYFTFTSTARPRAGQLQPTDPSRGRCRATRPLRPLPLSYPPRVRRSTRPALSALPLLSPPPFPSPGQVVQCLSNLLPAHGSDPVAPPSRVAILTRDSVHIGSTRPCRGCGGDRPPLLGVRCCLSSPVSSLCVCTVLLSSPRMLSLVTRDAMTRRWSSSRSVTSRMRSDRPSAADVHVPGGSVTPGPGGESGCVSGPPPDREGRHVTSDDVTCVTRHPVTHNNHHITTQHNHHNTAAIAQITDTKCINNLQFTCVLKQCSMLTRALQGGG